VRTFTRTKRPPRRKRRERTKNGCVAVPCLLRALEVEEREETGEEEEEEEETAAICDDDLKEKEKERERPFCDEIIIFYSNNNKKGHDFIILHIYTSHKNTHTKKGGFY
jgi:hypothetical protein